MTKKRIDDDPVLLVCEHCQTRITVIRLSNSPYPVKLPAYCPCCLKPIDRYQILQGEAPA